MTVLFSLAFALVARVANAADEVPDCSAENLGNLAQQDANYCAAKAYETADAALNDAYKKLGADRGPAYKAKLKKVELAWIAYRDAECALELDSFDGGSIAPMIYSGCMRRLTEQRTELLVEAMDP